MLITNNKCDKGRLCPPCNLLCTLLTVLTLFQNKLMKGFSNQLIEKHRSLKYCEEELEDVALEKVRSEFDELISLHLFLSVTGLQESTSRVRHLLSFIVAVVNVLNQ